MPDTLTAGEITTARTYWLCCARCRRELPIRSPTRGDATEAARSTGWRQQYGRWTCPRCVWTEG